MAVPVLMIATVNLRQWSQAGTLAPVSAGQAFWAQDYQVATLVAAGQASTAPPGYSPAPPPEPRWTVNAVPGLGAGTSNCSH